MNDFSEIYNRVNIQDLVAFLLYGAEGCEIDLRSPEQRLKIAENEIEKELMGFVSKKDFDEVLSAVHHYAAIVQEIHMEIGLRCGMKLSQLS